jgi:hypothetical protein
VIAFLSSGCRLQGLRVQCVGRILLLLCTVLGAACATKHRSDDLACTTNRECSNGAVCEQGFCIGGTTASPDARSNRPDAKPGLPDARSSCPAECTSCIGKTCNIVCADGDCPKVVQCPTGYDCDIECVGGGSCSSVICTGKQACKVDCIGSGSCTQVKCGTGRCDISCSGSGSCSLLDCNDSCGCSAICTGAGSCDTLDCRGIGNTCESAVGCELLPTAQCNRC